MSDYSEHLISMAGGDGGQLAAIQRRANDATSLGEWETTRANDVVIYAPNGFGAYRLIAHADAAQDAEFIAHARTDVPALLAIIREQDAQIERVRVLHPRSCEMSGLNCEAITDDSMSCTMLVCGPCGESWPCPTVSALTATEKP